jgi:hypothetical protein
VTCMNGASMLYDLAISKGFQPACTVMRGIFRYCSLFLSSMLTKRLMQETRVGH